MIIDGKRIAKDIEIQIKERLKTINEKPVLAVVLVGEDASSKIYVAGKERACKRVGIVSKTIYLESTVSQGKLNQTLEELSKDAKVNAVLLQLPLPRHLNARQAIKHIAPNKDVDGLTCENMGALVVGEEGWALPCTPLGVIKLIKSVKSSLVGLNACVVGRSALVGKPLAHMLLQEDATVTVCHSKTKNLARICKHADILVVATGQKHLINKKHIKRGAIVIDVGITKTEDGRLEGDVNFDLCKNKAGYITPVPGGVGPMTIAQLLSNVVALTEKQASKNA